MIKEAQTEVQDGSFFVHGIELNFVSFVGVVRNIQDNTSNLLIQIEDGTGQIDVRKWVDEKATDDINSRLVPGVYVYVTGSVKGFGGKTNINNSTFHIIEDYNQVIYHFLSVIDNYNNVTGKIGAVPGAAGATSTSGNSLFDSKPAASEQNNSVEDRIFECINEFTPSMPEGVPIPHIAQQLGLIEEDVHMHCQKLTEDAKIYVGYTDNGYLAV